MEARTDIPGPPRYVHLLGFASITQVLDEDGKFRPRVILLDEDSVPIHQEPLVFDHDLSPYRVLLTLDAHDKPVYLVNLITEFTYNQFKYHKENNIPSLGGPGTVDEAWAALDLSDERPNMDPIRIPPPK